MVGFKPNECFAGPLGPNGASVLDDLLDSGASFS
mgnify:FL=1